MLENGRNILGHNVEHCLAHAIKMTNRWLCYTKRIGELVTVSRITCYSQLGHGPGSSGRLVPKRVEALRKVFAVGVAAGTEHTAVVARSGVVSIVSYRE